MHLCAVVVGVGNYSYNSAIIPDAPEPLHFAAADARAVAVYLETCWPEHEREIEELYDQDVTQENVDAAFERLSKKRPIETLFIFLSGHGISNPDSVGFLLQPNAALPGQFSIYEADKLNDVVASCPAKQTILMLDCCYAGAVAARLSYFWELADNEAARLFIASSRANQVTWEDKEIGHGVFTAHLLDLLNTGDVEALDTKKSFLDVDGELFPILCEQVPLYTLKAKAAQQEPLKGGASAAPVFLPTVNATRALQSNTAFSTALRRFRQFLLVTATCIAILLIAAYSLVFHIEPTETGTLAVKRGLRWLEPAFRFLPSVRAETRLSTSQLSFDPKEAQALQGGYATGVWLHQSGLGYRAWADTVITGLNAGSALQYRALLGQRIQDDEGWALGDEVASGELLLRVWSLIGSDADPLVALLTCIPGSDRFQDLNQEFLPNIFDFSVLDLGVDQMLLYASVLEHAVVVDHKATWPHFLGFAKAGHEWLFHTSEATRGRGAHDRLRAAVADVMVRLINERRDEGIPPLDVDMINQLVTIHDRHYSDALSVAFARSGDAQLVEIARRASLALFQGNTHEPEQERALLALIYSLDGSDDAKRAVDQAIAALKGADALSNSYHIRLLIEAGASKSLSEEQISKLLEQADVSLAKETRDFDDLELARVLAFSMSQIPNEDRDQALNLIELIASEEPPMSSMLAQIYGALAEQMLDTPAMLAHTRMQVEAATTEYRDTTAPSESQPGMTILVSSDPWISTLASFALSRELSPEDAELLSRHIDNPRIGGTVARALALHSLPEEAYDTADQIVAELDRLARDFRGRDRVEALSSYSLSRLPREVFDQTMQDLSQRRSNEIESQTRASIGQIIIDAHLARSRPPDTDLPLAR